MRLPLATTLKSRNGLVTKDALIINGVVESNPNSGESEVYKRPGNRDLGLIRIGKAQLLYYWNGIKAIIGDFLVTNIPGSVTLITAWNPSDKLSSIILSNANLTANCVYPTTGFVRSALSSTSSWYWELKLNSGVTNFGTYAFSYGFVSNADAVTVRPDVLPTGILYTVDSGSAELRKFNATFIGGVTTVGLTETVSVYFNAAALTMTFYVNGVSVGVVTGCTPPSGGWYAFVATNNNVNASTLVTANFGATAFTYQPSGTSANLSPTNPGLPFSAQDSGSNAATSYLMFKNASQAWTLTSASGATPVQIVDPNYPGTYTVTLTSLTRIGTVATAATVVDTNFQVGSTVTIAGATPSAYNGPQIITGITASIIVKDGSFLTVTIARVSTTATATSFKPHGLTTGQTVQVAGCDQVEYNGTFTIAVLTLTTFTYTVVVTSTSTGAISSPIACTITRAGNIATGTTLVAHGLVSNRTITIAGANEAAYNGSYTATVVNQFSFTYFITVGGGGTSYTNPFSNLSVTSITRLGYTASAITASAHGLLNGAYVTISGAADYQYNGTFLISVSSSTGFTYQLLPATQVIDVALPSFLDGTISIQGAVFLQSAGQGVATNSATGLGSTVRVTLTSVPSSIVNGQPVGIISAGNTSSSSVAYIASNVTATTFDITIPGLSALYSQNVYISAIAVASTLTYVAGGLTTFTAIRAHGFSTGDSISITQNLLGVTSSATNTARFQAYFTSLPTITVTSATSFTFGITTYPISPPTPTTGTILANSLGNLTSIPNAPSFPATGAITLTSGGLTTTSPATPATGTISAKSIGSVTPGSFSFAIAGSPATPATGTITAFGGRNTTPGIVYFNGYFCVMDVFGVIYNSAIDNPSLWNALGYTTAQAETGAGMCIARSQSYVVAFKEWSTEFFYDAANPVGSPLSPVANGFIKIGCATGFSVAELEDQLIWMSQTRQKGRGIYMMHGTMQQKISTEDVDRVLNKDSLSEVFAYGIKINGHGLYIITLTNTSITLVYDLASQSWTQWSSLTLNTAQSITSITQAGGLATVTFAAAHNVADGDPVIISGAVQSDYNGIFQTSLISPTTLTINVNATAVTPATGTILGAGYTETNFKFTKFANALGQYLVLNDTDGHLYEIKPELNQDAGIPINTFFRTMRLDGGDLDTQKIMYRIIVVGDTSTDLIMARHSNDDSVSFSAYRPIDLSEPNPAVRRLGGYRRRSVELKHNTNNTIKLTALEIQSGV